MGRVVGALAATGAFLAKFGALLIKLKYVGLVLYHAWFPLLLIRYSLAGRLRLG